VEEVAASIEEAKRLVGRDEAERTGGAGLAGAAESLLFPCRFPIVAAAGIAGIAAAGKRAIDVGISKTARHTAHLKGAWPIFQKGN